MRCDDAAPLIDAFAEGVLDGDERAPVAAHVAACEACSRAVLASRRLSLAIARLPAASPSAAADALVLAAIEEERAWAAWRARTRRRVLAAGAAIGAVAVACAVLVATPAAAWLAGHAPEFLRLVDSWLRLRAAPALAENRGALVAAVAAILLLAVLDRAFSRPETEPRRG
jgi:hypothetical protein